jgi:hypothetical protein
VGHPGGAPRVAPAGSRTQHAAGVRDARIVAKEPKGRTTVTDKPLGFVALRSIKQGLPDTQATIAEIRRIYFKTTKRTIQHDIVHAIELLKSLPSEEERDKAAVYMEGLAQMRAEWVRAEKKKRRK